MQSARALSPVALSPWRLATHAACEQNARKSVGESLYLAVSGEPRWQMLRFLPISCAAFARAMEQAAEELVRRFEPLIRREVRLGIEDQRLNRAFDSMDVCQSVLGSFFVRMAVGEYDLEQPEQLVRLLVTMARNKLASRARQEHRQRRDARRIATTESETLERLVDAQPTPSEMAAGAELSRNSARP